MKRDFAGKAIFFVAFVIILVVAVYGFSGQMMKEKNNKNRSDVTTVSQKTSVSEKTAEPLPEKTTTVPDDKDAPKTTDKLVCLTFDDGPYAPVTNKILDTLEKYHAKATFFVVGDRADTYSDEIKRAADMGCEIGSHTYSHVNLTTLSVQEMEKEIKKSRGAISKIAHKKVTILRPPEGGTNETVKANVGMPLVMWSVDSRDWESRNADKEFQTVMDNVYDGSIVLMHDLYPATADAVARIVPELAKQGYRFVTFSELMKIREVDVEPGEKYFDATPQTPADDGE